MNWFRQNWDKLILAAIVIAFSCAAIVSISDCDGTIVRGLFWFECIVEANNG